MNAPDRFTATPDAAAAYERQHSDPGYDPADDMPDAWDVHVCDKRCGCPW